jgi:hypothetical protein
MASHTGVDRYANSGRRRGGLGEHIPRMPAKCFTVSFLFSYDSIAVSMIARRLPGYGAGCGV